MFISISVCPEGYYGDHCMEACECKNDNYICHSADGCVCRHGYAGPDCLDQLFSRNVLEKRESGYGSAVGAIFAGIMIMAISLAGWMYHRRRVANLKMEIAQVHYTAEPVTLPIGKSFNYF